MARWSEVIEYDKLRYLDAHLNRGTPFDKAMQFADQIFDWKIAYRRREEAEEVTWPIERPTATLHLEGV